MNMETIKNNMKLLRTMKHISQEELANIIHLTRSTYTSYESGSRLPDLQTLDALSAIYGISLDSLINHDLSQGLFHQIYLQSGNEDLANLLNSFQQLSIPAKAFTLQKLDILLDHENSIYNTNLTAAAKHFEEKALQSYFTEKTR